MAFLERNLEQLTVVQRQLVEQNSQLKKEAAIAERKLATRTERIKNLESLLHDSQEKLTAASHRFVYPFTSSQFSVSSINKIIIISNIISLKQTVAAKKSK
jgi:kinesin family protein 5